jgi:hypothetical protein
MSTTAARKIDLEFSMEDYPLLQQQQQMTGMLFHNNLLMVGTILMILEV